MFHRLGMGRAISFPTPHQQILLDSVHVRLAEPDELPRCLQLLDAHHYLGAGRTVGERLFYVIVDSADVWLGIFGFCAAARRLRARDAWIGWSEEQRRRRLAAVVCNSRFLILPDRGVPNLASRSLALALRRLSADWEARYGHPVLVVETFVDPSLFSGTLYSASGWREVGATDGCGRHARDFYVRHDQPKRLFVRELCKNACRNLQAEKLRPALAAVEARAVAHPTQQVPLLRSLAEHFKAVPDYRARIGRYPLWSLLTIVACAYLADAPRGQKDLAAFAGRLSQAQRRALGIRRASRTARYPTPSQPTFFRLFAKVSLSSVERALLDFQTQVRGAPPPEELVVVDGKEPLHTGGQNILSAITVPGLHYLGSAMVGEKTNEIPVARKLFEKLELDGRTVSLDAMHTQQETARALVLEHGADYILTVKGNQASVKKNIENHIAQPPVDFFP